MAVEYIRKQTPEEKRDAARARVMVEVRRGISPMAAFDIADLHWAFTAEEIAQLETEALEVIKKKREARTAAVQRTQIAREADKVLKEWDAQRRKEAEAEARKRLGFK